MDIPGVARSRAIVWSTRRAARIRGIDFVVFMTARATRRTTVAVPVRRAARIRGIYFVVLMTARATRVTTVAVPVGCTLLHATLKTLLHCGGQWPCERPLPEQKGLEFGQPRATLMEVPRLFSSIRWTYPGLVQFSTGVSLLRYSTF